MKFASKAEERRFNALKHRSPVASSLQAGQFQQKKVAPRKGRGSFRRHLKHKGAVR
jgi:stalled ribosome alternative rescue factor ArfA